LAPLTRRALAAGAATLAAARAAGAAPQERVFDSAKVPVRFIEEGAGEPVILMHGYTLDADDEWVRTGLFAALAGHYRGVALDARGHGRSGKPHDPAAYGPEMGLDIVRLMDHLGIPRAHVVGYSMGSHVVAQLLIARPERFLTATLGGAVGRLGWTEADQRRVDVEPADMDEVRSARKRSAFGRRTSPRRRRSRSASARRGRSPARTRARSRPSAAPTRRK
jgi:pimeloyl-ACP methyl ester carboxylesterase